MQTAPNVVKRAFITVRVVVLVTALLGVTWALGRVAIEGARLVESGAPVRADELLVTVVAGLAVVLSAWLTAVVATSALAILPGVVGRVAGGLADRLAPRLVRRVVAASLGLTIAAGVVPGGSFAAPARAPAVVHLDQPDPSFRPLPHPGWSAPVDGGVGGGPDDAVPGAGGTARGETPPDPGWVPTPPVVRAQPDLRVLAPTRREPTHDAAEVVVRRGDTLWSIAARQLGADASEAEVAAAWPRWFAANRDVVGTDPDLLLPGQVLRAPEAAAS